MTLCLALSAFKSTEASVVVNGNNETNAEQTVRGDVNVERLLTDIGFTGYVQQDYNKPTGPETIGIATASKEIEINGEEVTLIAVALRGQGYDREWASNLKIGKSGAHEGFSNAKDKVIEFIKTTYGSNAVKTNRVKFWITGYSRAAATANLVAAALDTGAVVISNCSYGPQDVYAYTFETPRGVLASDANNALYNNVFNILSGEDVVPKVAPATWGFSWYGTVKPLPTITSSGEDYASHLMRMLKCYESLDFPQTGSSKYSVGSVSLQAYRNSLDEYTEGVATLPVKLLRLADVPQDAFLDDFLEIVALDCIKNRDYYVNVLQKPMENIFLLLNLDEEQQTAFFIGLLEGLCANIEDITLILVYGDKYSEGTSDPKILELLEQGLEPIVIRIVTSAMNKIDLDLTEEELKLFVESVETLLNELYARQPEVFTSLLFSLSNIIQAHVPGVCLAWMQSMDTNYIKDASQTTSFAHGGYRIIRINGNCNVTVKDCSGNIVVELTVTSSGSSTNHISAFINSDGEKQLYLPADKAYTIEIESFLESQLSCWIAEHNLFTGTVTRIVDFDPIECNFGDHLVCVIPAWSNALDKNSTHSQLNYTVTNIDSQSNAIGTELTDAGAAQARYLVGVSPDGYDKGSVTGAGVRRYGTYAKITAKANKGYTFVGWYSNGVLVSQDEVYRFKVESNVEFVAKFEP